jgi:hypothetical protein
MDQYALSERRKRRSKYDTEGRNYRCQFWDKSYLSQAAVYTHVKSKHSGNMGDSSKIISSTRGRGRPKKNSGKWVTINPESEEMFNTVERFGGPTDPSEHLLKVIEDQICSKGVYKEAEDYPLYKEVMKYSLDETPGRPQANTNDSDDESKPDAKDDAFEEYDTLSVEQKYMMSWDEAFALYLRHVSQRVNQGFYKMVVRFIVAFREWLEINGWTKKEEELSSNSRFHYLYKKPNTEKGKQVQEEYSLCKKKFGFCNINNAENVPDIWNELITCYLVDNQIPIQRADAIDLTINLCHWLYVNGHTSSKLSLIS